MADRLHRGCGSTPTGASHKERLDEARGRGLTTEPDPLLSYRAAFPILDRTNYLISNSLGAVPAAVGPSLQSYFDSWATRGVRAWEEGWWTMAADTGRPGRPLDRCARRARSSSSPT